MPDWLKPLQLRAGAGYLDQFQNGTMASANEYRLYFNYGFAFKGPRRAARCALKQKTRHKGRVFVE